MAVQDVVYTETSREIFRGSTQDVVSYLERTQNQSTIERWVRIGASSDIIPEAHYLDLAT